jgi:hypothetical protein
MTMRYFAVLCSLLLLLVLAPFPCGAQPQAAAGGDAGWPRVIERGGKRLTVYQPQVDSWKDYANLQFRCAISVKESAEAKERFGVAEVEANTTVDQNTREVVARPVRRDLRFANIPEAEAARLSEVVNELLPRKEVTVVSLDQVLAYLEPEQQARQKPVEVNILPPKIFHSSKPAILVMFMGKPAFKPVDANRTDLMFAVNANWDIFFDTAGQQYFLLNDGQWLTAKDPLAGPWTSVKTLPPVLSTLPDVENWAEVRKNIPGKPGGEVPVVFAATEPAELILIEGEPRYNPVAGTALLQVANTASPLFLHSREGQFYFLVAGRWFRAKSLDGPWTSASTDLPVDFANIPADSDAAFVKASVPGTREAKDAILLASVPTSTKVAAGPAQATAQYSGEPKFAPIQGTSVQSAVNTASQIFLVDNAYYWCNNGAWLTSSSPNGPWVYCTSVPPAIYTIPANNPAHNVTYVTVQESTPSTVVYNQTSGYSGEYVATTGVVMFGMGLLTAALIDNWDDDWDDWDHHHYYPAPYYSYGRGAVYNHGYGGYVSHYGAYGPGGSYAATRAYGPYGGAGRVASYNAATGTYTRGGYAYGPGGGAAYRQAYNPNTGAYAERGAVSTPRGSASRFYAEKGGKSVQGGSRSTARGQVAGVKTSKDTGAVAWDTRRGQGAVVKGPEGNVYAGRNGNVYKKDSEGNWSQRGGSGGWSRPTPQAGGDTRSLERQASARQWGNSQSARASQVRSSPAPRSFDRGGGGGGRSGGGGRAGGGGRRR